MQRRRAAGVARIHGRAPREQPREAARVALEGRENERRAAAELRVGERVPERRLVARRAARVAHVHERRRPREFVVLRDGEERGERGVGRVGLGGRGDVAISIREAHGGRHCEMARGVGIQG